MESAWKGPSAVILSEDIHKSVTYAQERQQRIVDLLKERSRLSVPELEGLLGASAATVRRDLLFLEAAGRVLRTHGGILSPEHGAGEVSYDRKSRRELRAKAAIAEAAAALVGEGESAFVDAGTTAFAAGVRLLSRRGITVFTNSVPLLSQRPAQGSRLVSVGGEVRPVSLALVGGDSTGWMRRLRFDVALVGASGIDPLLGPTTTELGEARVKGEAVRAARRAILLCDASKWEAPAPIRFADWSQLDAVVTDHRAAPAERAVLAARGVAVHRVSL
jgi:DeoR/GlpR family transcriptional regulator of sugar metabolism